jgi:nicotinamidase-related amidase
LSREPLATLVDPAHTALIFQEMQNGVVGRSSALPEMAKVAASIHLVEACAVLASAARAAHVQVIHATAERRADGKGANRNARIFTGFAKQAVVPLPGSEAAQPIPEIGLDEADLVLPRLHGISPMLGTHLDVVLRNLGVSTVVCVGVSLNLAIQSLAYDAVNLGYQVVIARDAVVGLPVAYGEAVIENSLSLVATIVQSTDLAAAWGQIASRSQGAA